MAFTRTVLKQDVMGSTRVVLMKVTADAASGNVDAGVGNVICVSNSPASMATAAINVQINSLEAGTAAAGKIGFKGCASGDVFFVTVFGR